MLENILADLLASIVVGGVLGAIGVVIAEFRKKAKANYTKPQEKRSANIDPTELISVIDILTHG